MARDEDDDDGLPPLGENTDKFLDQAKKGQARNFLLVCKGNKVKYLAVRKKPVKKNELNEAKKAGYKGEGYFGVITGQGMDLVFNLSTADGYTAEPVKDKILKDFLEEKVGFKAKPTIAIVATLPEVPFDEDDLSHPLIARFVALAQKISEVLDNNPEAAGEIQQTASEIRLLLQDGSFDEAEPRIDAFEIRLNQLLAGETGAASPTTASTPQPSPSPAPVQNDDQALKHKLQDALNKLVPQIKQAVAEFPDKKTELLTPVAAIKKELESGNLQVAKTGILEVSQLLKTVTAQGTTGSTAVPQTPEVASRLKALSPSIKQALAGPVGNRIQPLVEAIKGFLGNKDFVQAAKLLDEIELLLQQVATTSGDREGGMVAFTQCRLQWDSARKLVASELRQLEESILETFADSPAMPKSKLGDLKNGAKKLYVMLETLDTRLIDKLDEALNATTPEARHALHQQAAAIVSEYQAFVDGDALVKNIDDNPFTPVNVRGHLIQTLAEISGKLR